MGREKGQRLKWIKCEWCGKDIKIISDSTRTTCSLHCRRSLAAYSNKPVEADDDNQVHGAWGC